MRVILAQHNGGPRSRFHPSITDWNYKITTYQPDIILSTETGQNWRKIPPEDRWFHRVHTKRKKFKTSFNKHHKTASNELAGGTAITSLYEAFARTTQMESDPSGLGRWTSARVQGKNNTWTRAVSVYRPTYNTDTLGTTYVQHLNYYRAHNRQGCPRLLILEDLRAQLADWISQGDNLIVGIDANEDVRSGDTASMFNSLGMRDAVMSIHGNAPPETMNRNNNKKPIDAIFVSAGISITASGYTGYNDFINSDHRSIFVDVPFTSFLGHNPPNIHSRPIEKLRPEDPRIRKNYIRLVKKRYRHFQNFVPKQAQLVMDLARQNAPIAVIMEEHNKLVMADNRARQWAADHCRPIYDGTFAWSPKFKEALLRLHAWHLIQKSRFRRVNKSYLIRRMKAAKLPLDTLKLEPSQKDKQWAAAKAYFREVCAQADVFRKDHLDSLAAARAKDKGTQKATELKQLKSINKARETGATVRRALNKNSKGLATVLHRPSDPTGTNIEVCDTQEALVFASMEEAQIRFTRASDISPFMQEPLYSQLGPLAIEPAADSILLGTYQPPETLDPYTKLFIQHLATPPQVLEAGEIPLDIPLQEHQRVWKRQNHHTSCDSRNLSFAHHKAGAHDPLLSTVDIAIRSAPLLLGFSPPSWEYMTDCSIPKKAKQLQAALMRIIVLMGSLYNMNNKMIGKRVMERVEDLRLMVVEQAGGRKNHQSAHQALNKVLSSDILRTNRQAGYFCCNDAIQCYDRIVHPVAILALRRLGVPATATTSMFSVLQRAKHFVMTGFGLSTTYYGGLDRLAQGLLAIQGVMQGNGAGPMIWLAISTVLVACMKSQGYGAFFQAAVTSQLITFAGFLFVDDADNIHTAKDPNTSALEILPEFQDSVDCWEGLLRATGGGINPRQDKTVWCLIDFKWVPGGKKGGSWKYLTAREAPATITIRSPTTDTSRVELKRIEPSDHNVTLGISIAFNGNWDGEAALLLEKAKDFETKLARSNLDRFQAWYSITNVIMMTLKYPLAAVCLSKAQWDKILVPILRAGLPKSGISKSFPNLMRFCPLLYQGLDIMHPYDEQQLEHLAVLIDHSNRATMTGNLLDVLYQGLQVELGLPGQLLQQDFDSLQHLATPSWMKSLWGYCFTKGVQVRAPTPDIPLLRVNDQYLMQAFIEAGYTGTELTLLQQTMQYLCAMTLADISTADGSYIIPRAFDCRWDGQICNNLHWPRSPPYLSQDHVNQWQQALASCFLQPTGQDHQLQQPLGPWIQNPRDSARCFLHHDSQRIYFRENPEEDWEVFQANTRRIRKGTTFQEANIIATLLPEDAAPATVHFPSPTTAELLSFSTEPYFIPPPHPPPPNSILEASLLLPPLQQWAVELLTSPDEGAHVAQAIASGTARGVSDGSFKEGRGTSAFVFHGSDPNLTVAGANFLPGTRETQSAYRSEAGGYYGALVATDVLRRLYNITTGSLQWKLDGESVISKLDGYDPIRPTDKHYDLLMACQKLSRSLRDHGIKVSLNHVKGHEDDHKKFHQLTWWQQRNVEMDLKAKEFLATHWDRPPTLQHLDQDSWQFLWQSQPQPHLDKTWLYEEMYKPQITPYLAKKLKIPHRTLHRINWKASKRALRGLPRGQRRWATKHTVGICSVGRSMLLRKMWNHSRCPRCSTDEETTEHVLRCPNKGARLTWAESIQSLDKFMQKAQTDPLLRAHLIRKLKAWGTTNPSTWAQPHNLSWRPLLNRTPLAGIAFAWADCPLTGLPSSKLSIPALAARDRASDGPLPSYASSWKSPGTCGAIETTLDTIVPTQTSTPTTLTFSTP